MAATGRMSVDRARKLASKQLIGKETLFGNGTLENEGDTSKEQYVFKTSNGRRIVVKTNSR